MTRLFIFMSLGLLLCSTLACNKTHIDGKWGDNIKLSQKIINVNAQKNSIVISTKSTSWWLTGISFKDQYIELGEFDLYAKNFVYSHPDFSIERKEEGKKIVIHLSENTKHEERVLKIGFQNGDYFDGIRITQAG